MADFTGQNIQDTYQRVVQVDDNQLQDGTGSNLPISFEGNNVIVAGSLSATEYSVTSSVTNILIATLSGSTEFGNSADDIHTFIGHITASGNISSSGVLSIENYARLKSHVFIGSHLGERSLYIDKFSNAYPYAHIFAGAADNNTQVGIKLVTRNAAGTALDGLVIEGSTREATFASVVNATALNTGHGDFEIGQNTLTTSNVTFNQVTAGTISSSGVVIGNRLQTDDYIIGDTSLPTGLLVDGYIEATHVTASGNISSSGDIISSKFILNNDTVEGASLTNSPGVFNIKAGNGGTLDIVGFKSFKTTFIDTVHSDITASGNISASGDITAVGNLSTKGDLASIGSGLIVRTVTDAGVGTSIPQPTSTLAVVGDLFTNSHITASGDISSSGIIISSNILSLTTTTGSLLNSIDVISVTTASLLNSIDVISVTTASLLNSVDAISIVTGSYAITGSDVTFGDITASNNISASGYIYSTNEDSFQFSFQTDADTLNWHGCNKQGLTEYYWNKDYGDDNGVTQIALASSDKRFMQAGWHVPYKCLITGWELLATGNKNNAPYTFTASLFTGDPISASIALHSDTSNDVGQILNLTEMHQSASLPSSLNDRYGSRYINAKGAMSYSLDAGQYVYPRVKHTTLDSSGDAQVNGNWTIYYRRVK